MGNCFGCFSCSDENERKYEAVRDSLRQEASSPRSVRTQRAEQQIVNQQQERQSRFEKRQRSQLAEESRPPQRDETPRVSDIKEQEQQKLRDIEERRVKQEQQLQLRLEEIQEQVARERIHRRQIAESRQRQLHKEREEQKLRDIEERRVKQQQERQLILEKIQAEIVKEKLRRRDTPEEPQSQVVTSQAPSRTPKSIRFDPGLIKNLLWNADMQSYASSSLYQLVPLDDNASEFLSIRHLFTSTNKGCFRVKGIKKVFNPYLLAQYELRKQQFAKRYGEVSEMRLFHGTRKANVDKICKENFNWRLNGSSTGHKFGQGVSFTPISNYATHYGDKTYDKVMILARVVVCKTCPGHQLMVVPKEPYDTSTNGKKHVYVKYDDNTFYPAYIIYYGGFDRKPSAKSPYR